MTSEDRRDTASDSSDESISCCIEQLKTGDRAAADQLLQRFFPRLRGLARATLTGRSQKFVDADDAVQSALRSFWRCTQAGHFDGVQNRDDLWRLLAAITTNKSKKHLERELALKRGGGRVKAASELPADGDDSAAMDELVAAVPAEVFDRCCEEWLELLADDLRPIAIMRLMGQELSEIAVELECSVSKVERKLRLIRKRWQAELDGER